MTVVEASGAARSRSRGIDLPALEPLQRYVTCRDPRLEPVLRDWLHQVYVRRRMPRAGLALRGDAARRRACSSRAKATSTRATA